MLSKSYVSATCRDGKISPRFVQETPENLQIAREIIGIYRDAFQRHIPLGEMKEFLKPIENDARNKRFATALAKLLDDRSEFSSLSTLDFPTLRRELFTASAQLLKSDTTLPQNASWKPLLKQQFPQNPLLQTGQLYGDLPENDCLLKFDEPSPQQLLQRYNLGLVQAILLSAKTMVITVAATEAQKLRRLCQYLRFFQLLAEVSETEIPGESTDDSGKPLRWLRMKVDGPAAVLEQGRRYSMQLATFFPAVCSMLRWKLMANIDWEGQEMLLNLDQSSQLQCPYHQFSAAIPEEIRFFQKHFQEKESDWSLVEDTPFLKGPGKELIFPDFSFRKKKSRTTIHLELFHPWHKNGLKERLEWLQRHPEKKLVVAVERALLKSPEINDLLNSSEIFQATGFLYRDFPTFDKTIRALEQALNAPHTTQR